jgi:hypothetical protein
MAIHLAGGSGCTLVLLVLLAPSILTAYFLHSSIWLIIIPFGIIALVLFVAALPIKRKVTPEQFADELEQHLLGTEGKYDWDDTTSVMIADPRLERVRFALPRFDSLTLQKDKDELRGIIAALRRGELPDAGPPTGNRRERGFIRLHLRD